VSIFAPIHFSFVDQSSPRRLENFVEDIPTSPEIIEAHRMNFKPNFKCCLVPEMLAIKV